MRLAGACAALLLAAVGHLQAQTSLTIYQDGRVMVRRTLPVALQRGPNHLSLDLGVPNVDPGTIVALDEGVEIRGVTAVAATGQDAALRRALGHEISFLVPRGDSVRFVRGTLLSLDPPTVRMNGLVLYGFPGTPAFPDSLVALASTTDVMADASRARSALRLAYQARGLQWHASYSLVLPAGGAGVGTMTGLATIEDPGALSFTGAEVQLLAGEVRAAAGPRPRFAIAGVEAAEAVAAPAPAEEAVGETHVYTLPTRVDFSPGETETVALFARADAAVEPEYVLRHAVVIYQMPQRQGEQDLHPEISYLVRRPAHTAFGDTPLPAGTVRVLMPDSAGRLQLVGEVPIQHTPAGRELHLATGTAFDLTAQRTQLTFEMQGQRASVSSYRVTIQNAKARAATVQVLEAFPSQWEVLSSTVPPDRLSASSVRFPVVVPAGDSATVEYRVRVRW